MELGIEMKKTMKHFLASGIIAIFPLAASFACECPPPVQGVSDFNRAHAVFVGVPTWIEDTIEISGLKRVKFEVTKVFKSEVGPVAKVMTPATPAACGIYFEIGKPYLVFAGISPEALLVRACEGTKLMSQVTAQETAKLSTPNKPVHATRETRSRAGRR